jgi:hypothetical protein
MAGLKREDLAMKRSLGLAAGMAAVAWAGLAAGVLCAGAAQAWQDRVKTAPGEPPIGIPPMPALAGPVQRIVGTVEALARSDVPAARAFAWDLTRVLMKHNAALMEAKVELPKPLQDLAAGPRPDPGRPTEADVGRIADQAEPLVLAAVECSTDRPPEHRCPPKLGVAVLSAVAAGSPSAAVRMGGVLLLVRAALPDPDGKLDHRLAREATPAVAASAARAALRYALVDVLAKRSSDDAARAVAAAVGTGLARHYVLLTAMASGGADAGAIECLVSEWEAQTAAARKVGHSEAAAYVLDLLARDLDGLRKRAGEVAETAAILTAVNRLAERFITAVNTENRAGAMACLTPTSAKALAEATSLRAAFTGRDDIASVVYVGLGPTGEIAGRRRVTVLCCLTDRAGGEATVAKEMGLVKTEAGWRLGEP